MRSLRASNEHQDLPPWSRVSGKPISIHVLLQRVILVLVLFDKDVFESNKDSHQVSHTALTTSNQRTHNLPDGSIDALLLGIGSAHRPNQMRLV